MKRFTLIMTCLSWCTFTNILYCNITVASWHLSTHDVKPVLCHNFIHIEAYLFDDLKNDEKPSRCLNLHLIKTCLSWCTIANQPSLRGITCPLLFREMVCPTTLSVVDKVDLNKDPNTLKLSWPWRVSWWTFTNLLYCTITVASWHLSIHDVKPVLCHNLIHIEAYLMVNEWRET